MPPLVMKTRWSAAFHIPETFDVTGLHIEPEWRTACRPDGIQPAAGLVRIHRDFEFQWEFNSSRRFHEGAGFQSMEEDNATIRTATSYGDRIE